MAKGMLPFVIPTNPVKGSFEHDLQKFLEKVPDQPNDQGCYEWMGAPRDKNNKDFHGAFYAASSPIKSERAHRWLYKDFLSVYFPEQFPPLKPGEFVRHACDNPKCVSPCHLIPGSPADNTSDMLRNGGSRAKVDAAMAAKMRHYHEQDGLSYGEIAKLLGVSKSTAHRILTGQWHPERRLAA